MSREIARPIICLALMIALLGWGVVLAQDAYIVARSTIASSSVTSGGDYTVRSTTGQATTSSISGGRFTVNGGYWHATTPEEGSQIFLPVLQR